MTPTARIVIKPVDKPPPKPKPTAREKADKVWKGKK